MFEQPYLLLCFARDYTLKQIQIRLQWQYQGQWHARNLFNYTVTINSHDELNKNLPGIPSNIVTNNVFMVKKLKHNNNKTKNQT